MSARASPVECLLHGEEKALSIADLLGVLLNNPFAIQEILTTFPSLTSLGDASPVELLALPSTGEEQVARLLASRELSRRRVEEVARRGTPILSAADAYRLLQQLLLGEKREVVLVLALDTKSRLTCPPITISIGTISSAPVHPREIFRPLIRVAASSCILAHLHPSSGEPIPSPEDIMLTTRLREAGDLLGIPVVDHLVLGNGCYLSMSDRGLI